MGNAPVEITIAHSTCVDELSQAWAFVMARVDLVGPNPRVTISPFWIFSETSDAQVRMFEVSVSGMIHEKETGG